MNISRLVFLLLALACCVTFSQGKILVVDQGSKGNFKTLEGAVASSSAGDEIVIRAGSYRENVLVDRVLTIRGEPNVHLNGLGKSILKVTADGCSFYNLSLEGSGPEAAVVLNSKENLLYGCALLDCGTGVGAHGAKNLVESCLISSRAYGVRLSGPDCRILNNTLRGGGGDGVSLVGVEGTLIFGNNITASDSAIDAVRCNHTTIRKNHLESSNLGVRLVSSAEVVLVDNDARGNKLAGIYLEGSTRTDVVGNTLTENGNGLLLKSSPANLLRGNKASFNQYGISLKGSQGNVLRNNTLEENQYNFRVEAGEASDLTLIASQGMRGSLERSYLQDIDGSNLADGRPVCYLIAQKDTIVSPGCSFVALIGCDNITVQNQSIYNSSVGVLLVNSTACSINSCNLSASEIGISLLESDSCSLTDNLAQRCAIGFWVARAMDDILERNTARLCEESGFRLEGDRRIRLYKAVATECLTGVSLLDALSCQVLDSKASTNGDTGIRLIRSHQATLSGNQAMMNDGGITLSGSNGCLVSKNNASNNRESGLSLEQLTGGEVTANVAMANHEGAFVQSVKKIRLEDNELSQNERYGLRMSSSFGCNVTGNRFVRNGLIGAGLIDCQDNNVYHNSFIENGKDFENNAVDNGDNRWDLGPRVGGNYWSDHNVVGNPSHQQREIPSKGLDRYPFQDPGAWSPVPA
jgi:parallel beta-helix repeat protein